MTETKKSGALLLFPTMSKTPMMMTTTMKRKKKKGMK